jgi:hypothetical protein
VKINLHIERLVMDDPGGELAGGSLRPEKLQAAAQAEIARQLQLHGAAWPVRPEGPARPVDGGQIPATGGPGAERIGRQIGRAIHRSVAK